MKNLPINAKDVPGMREFFKTAQQQACSLAQSYEGPMRELFEELRKKFEAALAALPTGEVKGDWCTEDVLNMFFSTLSAANSVASQLSLEISKLQQQTASAVTVEVERLVGAGELVRKADLGAQTQAAVKTLTDSGALVPKEMVTQLCSEAKTNGITEGRASLQAELAAREAADKLAGERRTALTQAGVALPPAEVEALLREPEEKFTAARQRYDERMKRLADAGITLASDDLKSKAWLGDDVYGAVEATLLAIPALKVKHEPLAGPAQAPPAAPKLRLVV